MTNLKKRVASQKVLRFLQNNKVIFFYQKKSVRSDHWRLLKKEIAKIEGVSSLNIKNKRDRREIQPLLAKPKNQPILPHQESVITPSDPSGRPPREKEKRNPFLCLAKEPLDKVEKVSMRLHFAKQNTRMGGLQDLEERDRLEIAEQVCGLLYAPNLILGSDSLKKLAHLSLQLKESSNLIFIGGWDGNQPVNHLDSLKLLETPQEIWKDGISCLSSSYGRPYLFFSSLFEKRGNLLADSLKDKMRALVRTLQERREQQAKKQ